MNKVNCISVVALAVSALFGAGCRKDCATSKAQPVALEKVSYERPAWKDRVSFMLKGPFDMSAARFFSFDLDCADPTAVHRGSCYFLDGTNGCYALPFEVNASGTIRITVDKSDCSRVEGKPSGWANITEVKVSVWFDGAINTACKASNPRVEPADKAQAVIVAVETDGEQCQWRQRLARSFDAIGIGTRIVSAVDLTVDSIGNADLIAIPGRPAPKLPQSASAVVETFRAKGGAVFKTPWKGLIPGECADTFAALMAKTVPSWKPALEANTTQRKSAAMEDAKRIASMSSKKGETRRMCVHDEYGPCIDDGWDWDRAAAFLATNGFTVLEANLCRGGVAFYDSAVLPVSTNVAVRGDQLEACLAACRRHGLELRVWRVCLNSRAPRYSTPEFESWRAAGLAQISYSGKPSERYLCPTAPENRRREVESMVELAAKGVDSVSFDYIRYPDRNHCFCARCRTAFEARYGAVASWPKDVRDDPRIADLWSRFKDETISSIVQETAVRIHRDYPRVKVCAAVMGDPDGLVKDLGQPWGLWARKGWIDVLMPMNYTHDPELLRQMLRRQKSAVPMSKLEPTIGPTLWMDDGANAALFARQIEVLREEGFSGFGVFQLDYRTARDIPLLRKGLLK